MSRAYYRSIVPQYRAAPLVSAPMPTYDRAKRWGEQQGASFKEQQIVRHPPLSPANFKEFLRE